MTDVPEQATILRLLGKPPPVGAQGLSAVGVAAALAKMTRTRQLAANEMRERLFHLQRQGLAVCAVGRGGAWTWTLPADGGASHRHPPRHPPERTR
jgi:hypothetical protein